MCDFILDCKTETVVGFFFLCFAKHKIMSFICVPGLQDLAIKHLWPACPAQEGLISADYF